MLAWDLHITYQVISEKNIHDTLLIHASDKKNKYKRESTR